MISVVKANKAEMTQNLMKVRGQVLLYRMVRREVLYEVTYEQSPECWVKQVMRRWGWECWEKENIWSWGNSRCKGWRVNLRAEEGASLVLSELQRGEWAAQEQEKLSPEKWAEPRPSRALKLVQRSRGCNAHGQGRWCGFTLHFYKVTLLHEETGNLSIPFSSRKNRFLLISWEVWSTSPSCYEKKETNFFVANDSNSEFNNLSYNI